MENSQKIKLLDIQAKRKFLFIIVISIVVGSIVSTIKFKDWIIGTTLLGCIAIPFLFYAILDYFCGSLVAIEVDDETVLFNYEHVFFNKKKCKIIQIRDIIRVEYSNFFFRLTVETNKDKFYFNIGNSDKIPIKSFVATLKEIVNKNQL